jgi:hypothetical protein
VLKIVKESLVTLKSTQGTEGKGVNFKTFGLETKSSLELDLQRDTELIYMRDK